jgi:uncharacterized metal-binding protein YceD (DUF177 family)
MSPRPDERLGPEFSRPFSVEALGEGCGEGCGEDEVVERIEATEAERQAIARRLALVSLDRLAVDLRLCRTEGGRVIAVSGHIEAEATQSCVVSLAPLRCQVAEDFTALYSLAPAATDGTGEDGGAVKVDAVEVDAVGDDPPEALGPDGLDLGEAVVQHLAMALDPYPRCDGATLEALGWGGEDHGEAAKESPFKRLKSLTLGQ